MATIRYIEHGDNEHSIDLAAGMTVMEGALSNGIRGIEATCGGACACATCHVYVDEKWLDRVDGPSEMETALLEFLPEVKHNSRLSCQILVKEELDGLTIRLPKSQV